MTKKSKISPLLNFQLSSTSTKQQLSLLMVRKTLSVEAIKKAISLCVVGADIYTLCQTVDAFVEEELKKVFNGKKAKKVERGIAFPCCVSVNHTVGHYSPLSDESTQLQEGDVAKIICGAHIDGYAANVAHTVLVGDKVDERKG